MFRYMNNQNKINRMWFLLLLCICNLLFMHYSIIYACHLEAELDFTSLFDNFMGICFDICILYIISYIISWRNAKIAILISFIISLTWSLSNVLYSRFFFHYLSISAIEQGIVLTEKLIFKCIIDSLQVSDFFYLVIAILFILFLANKQKICSKWSLRNLLFLLSFSIITDICAHTLFCISSPDYRYRTYLFHRIYLKHFATHRTWSQQNLAYFIRGSFRTISEDIITDIKGSISLSKEQLTQIKKESTKSKSSLTEHLILHPQNIIFIIVESYMSFTSDMEVNGKEITPFLNSLKKHPTVYFNGRMHENVTIGESSDGQFIYMTGILPLKSDVTVSRARRNILPGLPNLIGKESRMIIPTTTSVWNQDEMCKQYGFKSLYTRKDYKENFNKDLNDKQVFDLAARLDSASKKPFFSVILTMSMHGPYTEQIDSSFILSDSSLSQELKCYLNACHYTDKQIKKYFEHLINSKLYDNSLIIIAADHPVHKSKFIEGIRYIPLYIVNAKGLPNNMWQNDCNQLDVYTTILDLLGCQSNWYGLGHSLVSTKYVNTISDQTWAASDWIIRSNYFSKTKKNTNKE